MKNNGEIIQFLKQKDYIMINNSLGAGSFGKTVVLKDPFIDELFVAKKYEPYYENDKKSFYDSFLQEIKIMYKLHHRNIVRIFNYYPYESTYTGYIIMEYIDGIRIDQYLTNTTRVDDPDNIFIQLIDGFEYLEKQGILHRDIREGNILVTGEGTVKIIDFGLGKTFTPVDSSKDSMADIINRSGLDKLPNEYFEGKYDLLTDMFYLAELYNRLLRKTGNNSFFSYSRILQKMTEINCKNRFSSFTEIKEAITKKDFSSLEISENDKKVYQDFSNAIYGCLSCFQNSRMFVTDIEEFKENLHSTIQKNCFEDIVQNTSNVVSIIVKGEFKYFPHREISCDTLTNFEKWFLSISKDWQRLIINNIISKLSKIKVEIKEDELPF